MRTFSIPTHYRSELIGKLKAFRKAQDPRKKDLTPTLLDLGAVRFVLARHFGFCYGVENAIEISYKALEENPGKRIFLLSQMIHNQAVNDDLTARGMRFIQDTHGRMLMDWSELTAADIVIIPAFGTTLETEARLKAIGIVLLLYNTTCRIMEKVWKSTDQLGDQQYTVIIHGKDTHEETRATFSHTVRKAPALVLRDMAEAELLGRIILGEEPMETFETMFRSRASEGFDPTKDFQRVGVVNQTTMLATETQAIADHFKQVMMTKY